MDNKTIINCIFCGSPVMQLEESEECKVGVRCGNCKGDQEIICEKVLQIRIIPKEKLSTEKICVPKVKYVV